MAILKCKMCGGDLEITQGESVCFCAYCGTKQTLPRLDDEKKANMYDRANHFRRNSEFDKAMSIYEQILEEDREDAESYWSLVLCTYGIEYVEDPTTHKRVPTVNRTQYTSVFADENYKSALKYADEYQRQVYEDEAGQIDEIQKGILEISRNEQPFDVFICYKETDAAGQRTQDSVLANDLYHQLTQEGFRVFFSRITLEDKLGSAYEPYIFAALNSARVMVVLGTKPEYFNAVWVKNEWSRFLKLAKNDSGKALIPAYRDMDPYDLPQEFSHLQSQDMGKLGFMQDLIRGIRKLANRDGERQAAQQTAAAGSASSEAAPLVRRAFIMLEDGDFAKADELAESALNREPENAEAYLVKLMVELKVRKREDLAKRDEDFGTSSFYNKIIRFGDEKLKAEMAGYLHTLCERKEEEVKRKKEEVKRKEEEVKRKEEELKAQQEENNYQRAVSMLENAVESGQVQNALDIFESNLNYKDTSSYISKAQIKFNELLQEEKMNRQKEIEKKIMEMENDYQRAVSLLKSAKSSGQVWYAINILDKKPNYKDTAEYIKQAQLMLEELKQKEKKINRFLKITAAVVTVVICVGIISYLVMQANERQQVIAETEAQIEHYIATSEYVGAFDALENISDIAYDDEYEELKNEIWDAIEIGGTIIFGSYEGSDIEWTVLDKQGNKILLFSKYVLCEVSENYDAVEQGVYDTGEYSRNWAVSNTRAYMNGEFYDEAFSKLEKSFIKCSTIRSGVVNVKDGKEEYSTSTTDDYLFALSYSEYRQYCDMFYKEDENVAFFLRSTAVGAHNFMYAFCGSDSGCYTRYQKSAYIRPAMWVSIVG